MVDIEYQLVDRARKKLKEHNNHINVPQEFIKETAEFPTVTIVEKSNLPSIETKTAHEFSHNKLMYEVNIYTTGKTKKTDSKGIKKIIDDFFVNELGFNCIMAEPQDNLEDINIYRFLLRYECIIDTKTLIIYRR